MKRIAIALVTVCFLLFSIHADEVDPIFGVNPDNPFNLCPPVWVQGFWEDDIGYYHMQISPDEIVADFISYRSDDGGTELALSLLERLFYSQKIYELEYNRYDTDKHVLIYDAKLKTSINKSWNRVYDFWAENPFKFSSDYVFPISYDFFDNLGITKDDKAIEVKSKLQELIDSCNSFISEFGDDAKYNWEINRIEQDIVFCEKSLELVDEENYDFDSFLISVTPSLPTVLQLKEFLSKCSVTEIASYPYYGLRFFYDDVEFASMDFSRSEDELEVTLNLYCYNGFTLNSEIIEGVTDDDLELYGLRKNLEFEFREYSMNRKAVR